MKLIHLTAKRFAHLSADNVYVENLANNFFKLLGGDYLLVVGNKSAGQFKNVKTINLHLWTWGKSAWFYFWLPYIYYFFWLPWFILSRKEKNSEIAYFSSDANLLIILIFWKKILRLKFKICSDWHMLYDNFKDKFIPKNSDHLITTSEKLKKHIINRSDVNESKINVVYGGVDISNFQSSQKSRRELSLPEDKKLAGYIGLFKTMGMEKGIKTMITALQNLPIGVVMVFVGAKPGQSEEYEKYAEELGVLARCVFIDMQPVEKIPFYEKVMDVLVIPYPDEPHFRNWGFPMKVYEYMAAKKPIIYSKLDLAEEVIGDCAIGFKAGDAKDLADKINYILNIENKIEIDGKVEMAYKKAQNFGWEAKAKNIINILKND